MLFEIKITENTLAFFSMENLEKVKNSSAFHKYPRLLPTPPNYFSNNEYFMSNYKLIYKRILIIKVNSKMVGGLGYLYFEILLSSIGKEEGSFFFFFTLH